MKLVEIEKLSPVRVIYGYNRSEYDACSKTIYIDNSNPEIIQIENLFHEIGHAICDKNKCKCMINIGDHELAEYHASRYEMKQIKNNKKIINAFINSTLQQLSRPPSVHRRVAKQLTYLKQWTKFCRMTENV